MNLQSPRLVLETVNGSHAPRMFAGLLDEALYAYMRSERPASERALAERYERLASGRSPDGERFWLNWICIRVSDGVAVGYVQATETDAASAEIGYLIFAQYQREGYATEALMAMLAYLRDSGVRTVSAVVDIRNRASLALLAKCGFSIDKTVVSEDVIEGVRGRDYVLTLAL